MVTLSLCDAFIGLRAKWRRVRRRRCSPAVLAAYSPSDAPTVDPASLPPGMTSEPWLPRRQPLPWPMYRRVERRAVRMQEMIQRLDVDPGKLARLRRGDAYAEARARCLSCRASDVCLRWRDAPRAAAGPEFCSNLTLFEGCKRERDTIPAIGAAGKAQEDAK